MRINVPLKNYVARFLLSAATLFLIGHVSFGQGDKTKIKMIYAETGIFDESLGENTRKLIGSVQFKHKGSTMFCDSAYLFGNSNSLKAYGNVRIIKGDSVTVTGDSLDYNGNTEFAKLRGDVTLEDGNQVLKTNYLDYDLAGNFAYYVGGGVLTNKKDSSVLVSDIGYFYEDDEVFHFKRNVELTSPDYDIVSDTMHYKQKTEVVYFFGPTCITFDSAEIYCERGFYDQINDRSQFVKHVRIEEKERIIEGDSVVYDQRAGIGEVFCNSVITDTLNKVIIESDYAYLNENDSMSIATGYLTMKQIFDTDTLFLHSDSLITEYDSTRKNRILRGYRKVKFFKDDMQGKCDSLLYNTGDSNIVMYHDPVLWTDSTQMTGELIKIRTFDGKIDKLFIFDKSFIITEVLEEKRWYNQIKGRDLVAFFKKNEIHKIEIEGNGQTIYFTEEDDGSISGMNRLDCSNMTIFMDSGRIDNIRFYVKPDAILYPIKDLTEELIFYDGFKWREAERPKTRYGIYFWEPVTEGKGILPAPVIIEEDEESQPEAEDASDSELNPEDGEVSPESENPEIEDEEVENETGVDQSPDSDEESNPE